jgi:putative transcriptional regulator
MTVQHHPTEATLFAYAGGSLPEGLSLVVASHLALCPKCRNSVDTLDAVGGSLLEDLPEEAIAGDALARTMERLDASPAAVPMAAPVPDHLGLGLPEPLRSYVAGARSPKWRFIAPGIWHIEVMRRTPRGGTVQLLKIAPGLSVSPHSHGGHEFTLILRGAYDDELGRFGVGDMVEVDEETVHQPKADDDQGCICLVATEAPTRFKSWIGRFLQPFVGL